MNYFSFVSDENVALEEWNKSQFDLCDIVLSLTDNNIMIGAKIYAVFCRYEVRCLLKFFTCDFYKIKSELGIVGHYVERKGDIFDQNFNPKRNKKILTKDVNDMKILAKSIYKNILLDMSEIVKIINKK